MGRGTLHASVNIVAPTLHPWRPPRPYFTADVNSPTENQRSTHIREPMSQPSVNGLVMRARMRYVRRVVNGAPLALCALLGALSIATLSALEKKVARARNRLEELT